MDKVTPSSKISVDRAGFLYVDGVKVAKYLPEKRCLQFFDKDRVRSTQRGSNVVEVPLSDIAALSDKK